MKFFLKFVSYIVSLIPLWILLFIQYGFFNLYIYILIILIILIIFSTIIINKKLQGSKKPIEILKVKNNDIEYLSYIMTYIIPFAFLSLSNSDNTININSIRSLIFILFCIGGIYCKTNLYAMNPVLLILGWKTYKSTIQIGDITEDCIILSKGTLDRKMSNKRKCIYLIDDEVVLILK